MGRANRVRNDGGRGCGGRRSTCTVPEAWPGDSVAAERLGCLGHSEWPGEAEGGGVRSSGRA